ncbi:hypothetical protein ACWT_6469 [Actinoplanes sp. SE50]|nr:hypothetical protein ACPL_6600 [Actinoplanes sp. SE50/110]ATO85884.1 hypothetical protein ACWT_6469 [Actinoplanes sp. SE50]SLM03298.1 hypothetical protein ACSP50_6587 [Actinoplanes sp. SE50/110]
MGDGKEVCVVRHHHPDFGRLLPDGRSFRVVPTEPVDIA